MLSKTQNKDNHKRKSSSKSKKNNASPKRLSRIEVLKDTSIDQETKLLDIYALDDRMAYFAKMYSFCCVFLDSKGVSYKETRKRTYKYYIDTLYEKMLEEKRNKINKKLKT